MVADNNNCIEEEESKWQPTMTYVEEKKKMWQSTTRIALKKAKTMIVSKK